MFRRFLIFFLHFIGRDRLSDTEFLTCDCICSRSLMAELVAGVIPAACGHCVFSQEQHEKVHR